MNNQQGNQQSQELLPVVVLFAVAAVAIGIWSAWSEQISTAIVALRWLQLLPIAPLSETAAGLLDFTRVVNPADMTWKHVVELSSRTLRPWSWGFATILIGLLFYLQGAALIWRVRGLRRFGRNNDLEEIIREQVRTWRTILPITVDDPSNPKDKDAHTLYAEALHPEEWMTGHGIPVEHNKLHIGMSGLILAAQGDDGESMFPCDVLAEAWGDGQIAITDDGLPDLETVERFIEARRPGLLSKLNDEPMPVRAGDRDFKIKGHHLASAVAMQVPLLEHFSAQLRTPWTGFSSLPPHMQGLAMSMLFRAAIRRHRAKQVLEDMAVIWTAARRTHKRKSDRWKKANPWTPQRFNDALRADPAMAASMQGICALADSRAPEVDLAALDDKVIAILTKDMDEGSAASRRGVVRDMLPVLQEAAALCGRHAYVETAMLSLYGWAKQRGSIMAPGEFVWLRPQDRLLWYVMNSHRRPKPFVEAAGVYSHWVAETAVGTSIPTPMVGQALRGMQDYFYDNWQRAKGL